MANSKSDQTLILRREDVARLLDYDRCIEAVEHALASEAKGEAPPAGVLGVAVQGGGFHIKAATLARGRAYFAAKCNGNFPDNPRKRDLPTIQGAVFLADASNGAVLALMDSIEITLRRTAAASAVAAKYLARPGARVATVIGCGTQGPAQLRALAQVRRLGAVYAFDRDRGAADRFAATLAPTLGIDIVAVDDLSAALRTSDIVVACTPARQWYIGRDDIRAGTFVAAIGADHHDKQEIEPALLAASTVVVDSLDQCATIGDLHHALSGGAMTREGVHASLGQIAAGLRPGRRRDDETIVFDSTGTALQDVAAAAIVYEAAVEGGHGLTVDLGH